MAHGPTRSPLPLEFAWTQAQTVVRVLAYNGLASQPWGTPDAWRITSSGRAALRAQGVEVPSLSTRAQSIFPKGQ